MIQFGIHRCQVFFVADNIIFSMMTSSNGNIFHVTGPLCGEVTGHRWISLTKASDAELWCFFYWSAPWINGWVNNPEAGDLKRHRAHYGAIETPITLMFHINFAIEYMTWEKLPLAVLLPCVMVIAVIYTKRWGIICDLNINWNFWQGWYIFTYAVEF